jgi:hypothetical protein
MRREGVIAGMIDRIKSLLEDREPKPAGGVDKAKPSPTPDELTALRAAADDRNERVSWPPAPKDTEREVDGAVVASTQPIVGSENAGEPDPCP